MQNIVISSEQQVWDLLKALATASIKAEDIQLTFHDFPHINIKYQGDRFDRALPARCFESLKILQQEIGRVYATAVHGDEHYELSQNEKDSLEIFFKIDAGSSLLRDLNLEDVLNTIVKEACKKMEGKHIVTVATVLAASFTIFYVSREYLDNKKDIATIEASQAEETEETRRMEILASVIRQVPEAKKSLEATDRFNESVAKSLKPGEKVTMPDETEINDKTAKEFYPRAPRRTAEPIRIDKLFTVTNIGDGDQAFTVKIVDEVGKEFSATLSKNKDAEYTLLTKSLQKNQAVTLHINAKDFSGEIKELEIIGAEVIPTDVAQAPQ